MSSQHPNYDDGSPQAEDDRVQKAMKKAAKKAVKKAAKMAEEQLKEQAQQFAEEKGDQLLDYVSKQIAIVFGVDDVKEIYENFPMPTTSFMDLEDLPLISRWLTFGLWEIAFIVLASVFVAKQYVTNVTSTFISLDQYVGQCSEVPQSVSGLYLADTAGRWNVNPRFKYTQAAYSVNLLGLEYNTSHWEHVIGNIQAQVKLFGSKASRRDLAWNYVALASYKAEFKDGNNGLLQFSSSGTAEDMFYQNYVAIGFAASNATGITPTCNSSISFSYSQSSANLKLEVGLCENPPCAGNPCPGILAPQAFGYDVQLGTTPFLYMSINLQAVMTALSVNLGMNTLESLQEVTGDSARIELLNLMQNSQAISPAVHNATSSYYDNLHTPASIVYCTNYSFVGLQTAACYVRQGNTLLYPVIVHNGHPSEDPYENPLPEQCTKSKSQTNPNKYWCNLVDIDVAFIYYPVPNVNLTEYYTHLTNAPTPRPSSSPTYIPGSPTVRPSAKPTRKPTVRPTPYPTPRPTTRPSPRPTLVPTVRPTFVPTVRPTGPTWIPTTRPTTPPYSPSAIPTQVPTPLPSLRPSAVPTASPSVRPGSPTAVPTAPPSARPTALPSALRTAVPTVGPTSDEPTIRPSVDPTSVPTAVPTATVARRVLQSSQGNNSYYNGYYYGYNEEYTYEYKAYTTAYYADDAATAGDDYFPQEPIAFDNGLIFNIGYEAARRLNTTTIFNCTTGLGVPFLCSDGDIALSNAAFNAITNTLYQQGDFKKNFGEVCSGYGSFGPPGCAIFAFEISGGKERDISDYYYQPGNKNGLIAYADSIYSAVAFKGMQTPPTQLIQIFFSCTLNASEAFFNAAGLAKSNAEGYLAIGFTIYLTCLLFYLNNVRKPSPDAEITAGCTVEVVGAGADAEAGTQASSTKPAVITKALGDDVLVVKYEDGKKERVAKKTLKLTRLPTIPTKSQKVLKTKKIAEKKKKQEEKIFKFCSMLMEDLGNKSLVVRNGAVVYDVKAKLKDYDDFNSDDDGVYEDDDDDDDDDDEDGEGGVIDGALDGIQMVASKAASAVQEDVTVANPMRRL